MSTAQVGFALWVLLIAGVAVALAVLSGVLLEGAMVGTLVGVGVFTAGLLILWVIRATRGTEPRSGPSTKKGRGMAYGLVIGIPLGVALSAALDNYAFIGVGLAIGVAIGAALEKRE